MASREEQQLNRQVAEAVRSPKRWLGETARHFMDAPATEFLSHADMTKSISQLNVQVVLVRVHFRIN